jgi:hypothetical protein
MPTNTWKYKVENSRFVFDWEIITLPSVAEVLSFPRKNPLYLQPGLSIHAGGTACSPATLNFGSRLANF